MMLALNKSNGKVKLRCNLVAASIGLVLLNACVVTPHAIEQEQLQHSADTRLHDIDADQEPVSGEIDLYEAMARAIKYNLDYKVELFEQALRVGELDLTRLDMLPDLVAGADYSSRDKEPGGRSYSLETGVESQSASASARKNQLSYDLNLSWDILDFGLSYVRAQQQGDEILIAQENRRRVANRIVEDVRTAYWRAVSSEKLLSQLSELESSVNQALDNASKLEKSGSSSPLEALQYQRELLSVKLQIKSLHKDFAVAKKQLAALMNIKPDSHFSLAEPEQNLPKLELGDDINELVTSALMNRPELREIDYRIRATEKEVTAALLKLLPNIKLFTGLNNDTNELIYNNYWQSWGAQVSWNLFDIFRYSKNKQKIMAEKSLYEQQATAMAMAILTQVHISLQRFHLQTDEYETNKEYLNVQEKIDSKITSSRDVNRVSQQEWIKERMNTIIARLKSDISYASLQNIYANVYASIGTDAYPDNVTGDESVQQLSDAFRQYWLK